MQNKHVKINDTIVDNCSENEGVVRYVSSSQNWITVKWKNGKKSGFKISDIFWKVEDSCWVVK